MLPAPPPHVTGGAVDLEIIDENGEGLDFSSPYKDDNWCQAPFKVKGLTKKAYANRKLLKKTLEAVGLTNYVDDGGTGLMAITAGHYV